MDLKFLIAAFSEDFAICDIFESIFLIG